MQCICLEASQGRILDWEYIYIYTMFVYMYLYTHIQLLLGYLLGKVVLHGLTLHSMS